MRKKDSRSKFSLKNLRQGGKFKSGKNTRSSRGIGWKGAIHSLTRSNRRAEYKNLSRKDVEKGSAVLKAKLKSKDNYGGGLDRKDIKDLNHTYEKMRRAGELSSADVKDFKKISSQLKQSSSAKKSSWW